MNSENTQESIVQPVNNPEPVTPLNEGAPIQTRKARSVNGENAVNNNGGGLDSLGQGYLLVTDE